MVISKLPKLRRLCRTCGELFEPSGKFCRICNECNPHIKNKKYPVWLTDDTIKHLEQIKKQKLESYDKLTDSDLNQNKTPTIN